MINMKIIKSESYKLSDVMISPSPRTVFNIIINHKTKGTPEEFYSSASLLELLRQEPFIYLYLFDKNQKVNTKDENRIRGPYSNYSDYELQKIGRQIGYITLEKSLHKPKWDREAMDEENIKNEETYMNRKKEGHDQYYYVTCVLVKHGYGPMLYDKAIEVVSKLGCKLLNSGTNNWVKKRPRPQETSPEAWNLWNKYRERKDVTKHELGEDYFALSKDQNSKFFYE